MTAVAPLYEYSTVSRLVVKLAFPGLAHAAVGYSDSEAQELPENRAQGVLKLIIFTVISLHSFDDLVLILCGAIWLAREANWGERLNHGAEVQGRRCCGRGAYLEILNSMKIS